MKRDLTTEKEVGNVMIEDYDRHDNRYWSNTRKQLQVKEYKWPPEARKGKETYYLLQSPKGTNLNTLTFAQ